MKNVLKRGKRKIVRVVKCHLFLLYYWRQVHIITSTRLEVFCKKRVLKHFAKLIAKHLFQSLCFNNIASLKAATLLKKILLHRYFPVNFSKFFRRTFIQINSGWLQMHSNVRFPVFSSALGIKLKEYKAKNTKRDKEKSFVFYLKQIQNFWDTANYYPKALHLGYCGSSESWIHFWDDAFKFYEMLRLTKRLYFLIKLTEIPEQFVKSVQG